MYALKLAATLGSAAILLAGIACGDDDDDTTDGGTALNAELDEYTITLDRSSLPAGDVDITAENVGQVEHELIVAQTDFAADSLPLGQNRVDEERIENQGGEIVGEIEEFPPGETETATFTLDPGSYVLFCNLPGHYELGMHTTLTVE